MPKYHVSLHVQVRLAGTRWSNRSATNIESGSLLIGAHTRDHIEEGLSKS